MQHKKPIVRYENTRPLHYYLLKEQDLPENIDLYDTDLTLDLDRKRLAKLLKNGLNHPSGFVLPLEWMKGVMSYSTN